MAVGLCCWIYGWESNTGRVLHFDSLALLWCVNEVQQAQDHVNLQGLISVCNEMPAARTSKLALIQIIFWKTLCILRQLVLGITVTTGGDDGRGGGCLMLIPSVPVQYSFWFWFPKGGAALSPTPPAQQDSVLSDDPCVLQGRQAGWHPLLPKKSVEMHLFVLKWWMLHHPGWNMGRCCIRKGTGS